MSLFRIDMLFKFFGFVLQLVYVYVFYLQFYYFYYLVFSSFFINCFYDKIFFLFYRLSSSFFLTLLIFLLFILSLLIRFGSLIIKFWHHILVIFMVEIIYYVVGLSICFLNFDLNLKGRNWWDNLVIYFAFEQVSLIYLPIAIIKLM